MPTHPRAAITTRLVLVLTLVTTMLWCVGVAGAGYKSYRELDKAFDAALKETALRLLPLARDDVIDHENDDARAIQRLMRHRETYLSYQLFDQGGRVLLVGGEAPSAPYAFPPVKGFLSKDGHRLYSATDAESHLTITVAESLARRLNAVFGSVRAMLWPLVALIPMNALVIWFCVRGGMAPLARLREDIAARDGDNLAPLDVSDQPAELRPIADAVARLLERLRTALDAERAFAANSAHELRTPIAGALAQTQRLVAELRDPRARRRASDIEAMLKRLARLSEKLIQLSRVDAGLGFSGGESDLLPVVDMVVRDLSGRAPGGRTLQIMRAPGTGLTAQIDPDAFAIALRNLVENALVHGAPDGPVEICIEPGGVVRVVNAGATVDADTLSGLTGRFARGRTHADGSGLGLAIVAAIMSQAGAQLALASPPPGRSSGFEARLELRLAASQTSGRSEPVPAAGSLARSA